MSALTDRTYSTEEVCRMIGVSYRVLDHWIRRDGDDDVYQPAVRARGTGSRRRFTDDDVERLRVVVRIWKATRWMAEEARPRAERGLNRRVLAELFRCVDRPDGRLPKPDECIDIVTPHGLTLFVFPEE